MSFGNGLNTYCYETRHVSIYLVYSASSIEWIRILLFLLCLYVSHAKVVIIGMVHLCDDDILFNYCFASLSVIVRRHLHRTVILSCYTCCYRVLWFILFHQAYFFCQERGTDDKCLHRFIWCSDVTKTNFKCVNEQLISLYYMLRYIDRKTPEIDK